MDVTGPAGFVNGRQLTDSAVDIMFALSMLDLGVHPADLFVGLLNPVANDVAFSAVFPYLAAPH